MASFLKGYDEARKKKPGFAEGGMEAQGRKPLESIGYQAGNIANQVSKLAPYGTKYDAKATRDRALARSKKVEDAFKSVGVAAKNVLNSPYVSQNLKSPQSVGRMPGSYPDNDSNVISRTTGENAPFPAVKPRNEALNPNKTIDKTANSGIVPNNPRKDILLTNRNGPDRVEGDINAFRERARKALSRPPQTDGRLRVGNMDVRFDPSVSQAARQRFLAQPTAPGTRRVAGIGMVRGPERPQERKPPETFGEIMQERWRAGQERRAESRRSNAADEALKRRALDQGFFTDQQRIGIGQQQLGIDQQRVGLEGGRLGLDASRVSSENALRDQQMREGQLSLGRSELISNLQQRYLNPSTPDTEKQQIADQLRFLSGDKTEYKPITIDQYDDKGFQTGQQVKAFDPRTGQVIGGQQEQDPVMSVINSNPQYRKVFEGSSYEERQRIIKQIQERLNLR